MLKFWNKKIDLTWLTDSSLPTYWVKAEIKLEEPFLIEGEPDSPPAVGYFQNFGISCEDPDTAKNHVVSVIKFGEVNWRDSECYEIDPRDLDRDVVDAITPISGEGIWYQSGRVFYPEEDLGTDDFHLVEVTKA